MPKALDADQKLNLNKDKITVDAAFKAILQRPYNMIDFLEDFLPSDIKQYINFDSAQLFSEQTVTEKGETKIDDIVYLFKAKTEVKAESKTKAEAEGDETNEYCILVILENQSKPDAEMPWRILQYTVSNIRKVIHSQGPEGRAPYVLPIVFYLPGKKARSHWDSPISTFDSYQGSIPDELKPYIPLHTFILIDVTTLNKEFLEKTKSTIAGYIKFSSIAKSEEDFKPFLGMVLMQFARFFDDDFKTLMRLARKQFRLSSELVQLFLDAREKFEKGESEEDIMTELSIATYDRYKFEQGKAEGKAEGEAKGKAEGEAKGKAEGEAKGKAETLLMLLKVRFSVIPALLSEAISLAQSRMDGALLDKWTLKLFDAREPKDLKDFEEMVEQDKKKLEL